MPGLQTAKALWTACDSFHNHEHWFAYASLEGTLELLVELRVAESAMELLSTLVPHMQDRTMSKTGGSDTGSSSGSDRVRGGTAHSGTSAASRAACVLRERRYAASGPFPSNLLCVLGSTLQLVETLCTLVHDEESLDIDRGEVQKQRHILRVALALHKEGQLLEILDMALAFLLRRARDKTRPSATAPACFLSARDAQLQSSRNMCTLGASVFKLVHALPEAACQSFAKLPSYFMDKLCCLACEALNPDHEAAFDVTQLIVNDSLGELISRAAGEMREKVAAVRYVPAMRALTCRIVPDAFSSSNPPECAFGTLVAVHVELATDPLLSPNIKGSDHWKWPESLSADAVPVPYLPGSSTWASTPEQFFPHAEDTSLERLVALLADESSAYYDDGDPVYANNHSVYYARSAAVLLSILRSKGVSGQAEAASIQQSMLGVARYTSALSTQLLHAVANGHAMCDRRYKEWHAADQLEPAAAKRAAAKEECLMCSSLAEGVLAMLLQLLAQHAFFPAELSESDSKYVRIDRVVTCDSTAQLRNTDQPSTPQGRKGQTFVPGRECVIQAASGQDKV